MGPTGESLVHARRREERMSCGAVDALSFPGTDIGQKINNAMGSFGLGGGTICVPPGDYSFSTPIVVPPPLPDLPKPSITIEGAGSTATGAMTTILRYTGSAQPAVSARGTTGFTLRRLMIIGQADGFSNNLVDLSGIVRTPLDADVDTALALIDRCYLGNAGTARSNSLVYLDRAISSTIRDSAFVRGVVAIRGKGTNDNTSYSNAIQVLNNFFKGGEDAHIVNAHEGWLIQGNTFEQRLSGAAGAYADLGTSSSRGLSFIANWCGDASGSGSWLRWAGNGLIVQGNYLAHGDKGIEIAGSSNFGIAVIGNDFEQQLSVGVDLQPMPSGQVGVSVVANRFTNVPTPIANLHQGHAQVSAFSNSGSVVVPNYMQGALTQNGTLVVNGGNLLVNGQLAASKPGVGSTTVRDFAGGIEVHIRPDRNKVGVLSFTEDSFADLWTIRSGGGDPALKVGTGSATASVDRLVLRSDGTLELTASPKFGAGNVSGSGVASLGSNCPATTPSAPVTWLRVVTADGGFAFIPCWR